MKVLLLPRLCSSLFSLMLLALLSSAANAMDALDDGEMSDINGAGIVYALDDFSFRMAPTSYIELIGSTPSTAAATYGWKRGDARYYGLSFSYGGACDPGTGPGTGAACANSGASVGQNWVGTTTSLTAAQNTANALRYPIGRKASPAAGTNPYGIVGFASVYNPFILRVFQYQGYDYAGNWLNTAANMPTILEFMGPSETDSWRWAFWGELLVNSGATSGCPAGGNTVYCGLKSQVIVQGSPTTSGQVWNGTSYTAAGQRKPAILRLMQTTDTVTGVTGTGSRTLGLNYQSALSGDFRMSVKQTVPANAPDTLHTVPVFDDVEGMYFKNVDAFMPLGYLHSQALIASGSSSYNTSGVQQTTFQQNGNFVLELARVPNVANVYNNIYCGNTGATAATCGLDGSGYISAPNADTHGYVRWGNWTTTAGGTVAINPYSATLGTGAYDLPSGTSTANGIYFIGATGTVKNLGIGRIEGLMIQHLKISTLGAGVP